MDDNIIALCKKDDSAAWHKLYAYGFRLATWVAKKKLCNCGESIIEEIAQETMIAVSDAISSVKDACHCERLIRSIARNKSIDYIRSHQAQFEDVSEDLPAPEKYEIEEPIIIALHRALGKLGYPCKPILRRFYLDNAKHREIAEEMGVEVNQIGMRIKRCLKNLHSIIVATEKIKAGDVL